jgi:hypothetical protein
MTTNTLNRTHFAALGGALLLLALIYLTNLQTIPSGSGHYYMIDVGETQIVLNVWGTLHATGYPLYVIIGNVLTSVMRGVLGVDAVVAPALVSMWWGMVALGLFYLLAVHLTGRIWLSLAAVFLFGLSRTMWVHMVIAEVYTFNLVLLALLLLLALWREDIPHRVYWLALVGGIGVAHHRGIAMSIPALVYAVWPYLTSNIRRLPRMAGISLLLGLMGFTQYAYLYMRARAGANWVYGEPGTLPGLWDQFIGTEASRFIGPAETARDFFTHWIEVNGVYIDDLTLPGVLVGLLGLAAGITTIRHRRAALTIALCGSVFYGFQMFFSELLPAFTLPGTLALVFGWLFGADVLLRRLDHTGRYAAVALTAVGALLAGVLILQHQPFIRSLTSDPAGLEAITKAYDAPPGSTLMIGWGPRYFAASIERDLYGHLQHITLVDHQADFAAIVADGTLITPEYTFYNHPVEWWEARIDTVYLRAAAPYLVEIGTQPELADDPPSGVTVAQESLVCEHDRLLLDVVWQTDDQPAEDLSVFVHVVDSAGQIVAQGDQRHPVYGWRPLTTWQPREQVRDIYPVALPPGAQMVRYGLYRVLADSGFENVLERELVITCQD